ncbi:hypothetical protein [Xanthobacter flavus]|uniref:hypothetical protein n=1 Tax=Xanthobacter flavus TaxID=281 RepID=UPI00372BDA3F
MRFCFVGLMALGLAGCAAGGDAQVYQAGLIGQKVVGNEAYVTVWNVWTEMEALPLAEGHCRQYGKIARFNKMERARAIFDCVRPV